MVRSSTGKCVMKHGQELGRSEHLVLADAKTRAARRLSSPLPSGPRGSKATSFPVIRQSFVSNKVLHGTAKSVTTTRNIHTSLGITAAGSQ